ncbi:MAG: pyridoxal phosphate-dependent aminotransferase family protein [Spirochaetes bacterium]|nr:pyridoxal phosphate-dependent aminotransferase family protein [Spirochaetota bacterium]
MSSKKPDIFDKCGTDGGYFGKFRIKGDKYFTCPVLDGLPGPRMEFNGKEVVMWAVNNYTGLAGNEEVKKAALEAVEEYGTFTPMGSRLLTGNTSEHMELEKRLSAFLEKPASILYNYGYLGVIGTISALVGKEDTIVIDKLSHASMVDAAILASAGKRFRPYRHNDMESLEFHLKSINKDRKGGILIITEGVFGMKGDLAKLDRITELKEKYEARLFIDDAHGFGVMGDNGKGTGEYYGVQDKIDIYFGTFAKAFAAIGGVAAGETDVIEWIRYNARTNVFAKSLPMVFVRVLSVTLDILEKNSSLRERMWKIAKRLQTGLVELGFDIGGTQSPITPVYVPAGSEDIAMSMISMLREDYGVFVSGVTYPVVPPGIILFRMIPTASHSEDDVDITLKAFKGMRDRLKLDLSSKPSGRNR